MKRRPDIRSDPFLAEYDWIDVTPVAAGTP
jgi:hypothetical protein